MVSVLRYMYDSWLCFVVFGCPTSTLSRNHRLVDHRHDGALDHAFPCVDSGLPAGPHSTRFLRRQVCRGVKRMSLGIKHTEGIRALS
jgi:hypothetical protein